MTTTQLIILAIAVLALLLASQMLRSAAIRRGRPDINVDVGFRKVGTFGGLAHFDPKVASPPRGGSITGKIAMIVILPVFVSVGVAVKFAWDKTHPDIRTTYGRHYEQCVSQGISRWNVSEVNRCIHKGHEPWNF